MEVVPVSVGRVSRRWDEQRLDLAAAARQIRRAPTSGFSPSVAPAADRFTEAWHGHTRRLAGECEQLADGLRVVIGVYLRSDEAAWLQSMRLIGYLSQVR